MRKRKKPLVVPNVLITGIADKGKGVGRDENGRVIFVENVAPGDVVDVLVQKKKAEYLLGIPQQFHQYSTDRTDPFCQHYGICGGCKWQHLQYEAQARHKETVVKDALARIGKVAVEAFLPMRLATATTYYRNKLEFAFSNKRWLTKEELSQGLRKESGALGFHRPGMFDKIVDIEHCWLQPDPSNEIRNAARAIATAQNLDFFDLKIQTGFLRHLLIRVATTGEVMVILSVFQNDPAKIQHFLDALLRQCPAITTLIYCINPKVNDFLLDLEMHTWHGKGYIEEQLGHVRFKIGPKSFFQTNTRQGKLLYDVAMEFADLQGTENVYDLYTGVGSIALYAAKNCKQVVGIEEIESAIDDARENAQLNGISNTVFYARDVKDMLTPAFVSQYGKPDVLITDPPRAGMHQKVVEILLALETPKIVYVSCNPATQARDLSLLAEKYEVKKVQVVDMFPHTHHIENVALLQLRER